MIKPGDFITLIEIVPPHGWDCSHELDAARRFSELGVTGINVPDSPRASARMSALSLCHQIQQHTGTSTVLHFTCRDRNLLGIQSDLLGAYSLGIRNILCIRGDSPKHPSATGVFDVDAVGLIKIIADLNQGIDIAGKPITQPTAFSIGAGVNPGSSALDTELTRLEQKIAAGAEYIITQPVFDPQLLNRFLKRIETFHIPVIAGIWPLSSQRNAAFMRHELGVAVADDIFNRMTSAAPDKAQAEGIAIAQEMIAAIDQQVQGIQISAPYGHYEAAIEVLAAIPCHTT